MVFFKLHMFETYHKILKTNIADLEVKYMHCHSFFLSFKTENIIKDLC